jgi:outer membrane protein assembly factor BamB
MNPTAPITNGLTLLFALLLMFDAAFAEDWPRWRGERGDGTWQAPAIPEQFPEKLPVVWRQSLGPGYSGVTVADRYVLTMDRPADPPEHERVVCFDRASGKQLWEHVYPANYKGLDYPKGPRSAPTIHERRVYTLGAVGHLHCLDLSTGEVVWRHDLVKDHKAKLPLWGLSASPVVDGDQLLIHAGLPGGCYSAYDLATGRERWRAIDDPAGYATPQVVEHAGKRVVIGWTPSHVVSLDTADGKVLWKVPYEVTYGVSIADPIIQEGLVLVCGYWEGSTAIRLGETPSEAKIEWEENRFLRGLMSQPLYRDGHVYLLDKQHGIVCFRLSDGEKRWTDQNTVTKRDRNPQASLVWIGDSNRALALNAEGELVQVRLTPEKFEELSRVPLVGPTWAHPAYAGEHAFARDDEQIVCVRLTAD